MAEVGMPLLIHGEVTAPDVDIFDKEARFIVEVIKVRELNTDPRLGTTGRMGGAARNG